MRAVTGSMGKVVQGMDVAMRTMDLEKMSAVMDKFEQQFADLDVQTGYMEDTMRDTTAVSMPQDQVDLLMQKVGLSLHGSVAVLAEQSVKHRLLMKRASNATIRWPNSLYLQTLSRSSANLR